MKSTSGIAAALGLATTLFSSLTSAAVTTRYTGESQDVIFKWGVPQTSTTSGSGDIYFQLDAPGEYSWIGLGIGSRMAGSPMFIIYQDGRGNVTLSTRQGEGHRMPLYTERSDVQLLAGSGLVNGHMIANVKCSACNRSLDLGGSNSWIAAWKKGRSLATTNMEAVINEHDDASGFSIDLSQATISSNANPFLGNSVESPVVQPPAKDDEGYGEEGEASNAVLLAHAFLMGIAFIILYPLGSALMPLLSKWYLHAAWQFVAYVAMWAGFGTGYVYAESEGYFFKQAHTGIGVFVVAFLGIQPILGALHHTHYVKYQRRGIMGHVHIWYGRILIILGIINGGLGLQLSATTGTWVIVYSVVSAVVFTFYLGSIFFGMMKNRRKREHQVKEIDTPLSQIQT